MIQVYALMFFTAFLRQSTTSPPANLNEWVFLIFMFVLIQGGGLGIIWLVIKTRNDVWQKQQEANILTNKTKADTEAARAKADTDEDSAIASALIPLIDQNKLTLDLFGRVTQLSSDANALLKSQADMMKNFNEEQIKARALWHSSMEGKMADLEKSMSSRDDGNAETLKAIRDDIKALNTESLTEVKSQLATIVGRLEELQSLLSKTVTSDFLKGEISALHDELKVVTGNVDTLATNIEKMIAPPEVKPVLTAPEVTVIAPPESKPQ